MPMISFAAQRSLIALFVVILVGFPTFVYFSETPINHDTGWFLYAARGMLHGGVLYRDFFDVNAPLAYVMVMPAAWLIEHWQLSNEAALTLNVFAFILPAYFLSAEILKRGPFSPIFYCLLLAGIFLTLSLLPGYAFGQREHIFAVLSLPYIFAAARRKDLEKLPTPLAFACGVLAGIGASIKLPFLILILIVEAAVLLKQPRKISFSADLIGWVMAFGLISIVSFCAYPIYWTKIVPSVLPLYAPYNNFGFLTDALFLLLPLFMTGLLATDFNGNTRLAAFRGMMAVATFAAFGLFILQQKGWPHQAVPIMIFTAVLCLLNVSDFQKSISDKAAIARGCVSCIVLLLAFCLSFSSGRVDPSMIEGVRAALKGTDGSFYIMSTGNYPAFPLGLESGTRWTSRFPQLILLPGLIDKERTGNQSSWEPWFRNAVLEDIEERKPSTIFVFLGPDVGMPADVDLLAWFRSDSDFDQEWSHYEPLGQVSSFAIFKRRKAQ